MGTNGEAVIELRGVSKIFRTADRTDRAVLEGVDLTLRQGEIVAMLGKSGSGKSTLLRIMAGLVRADRGKVLFAGANTVVRCRASRWCSSRSRCFRG